MAGACAGRLRPRPPQPQTARPIAFVATAYCTGSVTAAGTRVADGIVAADPSVLLLGTVIRISGLKGRYNGVYTVMDTGPNIRGHRLDLYIGDCAEARRFGRQSALVWIVRRANAAR